MKKCTQCGGIKPVRIIAQTQKKRLREEHQAHQKGAEDMIKVKCPREECGHEWTYKGKAWWITCPQCRKLFKNPERVSDK